MKNIFMSVITLGFNSLVMAQDVAMDFEQDDCYGNPHHLFEYLDGGNVAILEFFMTNCTPCINAGNQLKPHFEELLSLYPGKVEWFHFGFTDSYPCQEVMLWVEENGFPSFPMTDGAAQVAYYGGFGMPTIVVVAGAGHEVLYNELGYSSGDDDTVHEVIVEFLGPVSVQEQIEPSLDVNLSFLANTQQIAFDISNSPSVAATEIEIFNAAGSLVYQNLLQTSTHFLVDAQGFSNGIYVVSVRVGSLSASSSIQINR
ncbi:MAG: hypothetical protein JNM00_10725 [Flavobacteriales bacterium]|nr:hypothetical protein [Flavobacteriales bacterium]